MANGQAEPRPTILAGRRAISLGKRLEDQALFFRGNTDTRITYRTVQGYGRSGCRLSRGRLGLLGLVPHHFDHDVTLRGKLESIPHEIREDLAPPNRIADEAIRHIGVHIVEEFEVLVLTTWREGF